LLQLQATSTVAAAATSNYKYDRRTLLQLQPLLQNPFLEVSFFLVEAVLSKSACDSVF
jgi:hypothetical protein